MFGRDKFDHKAWNEMGNRLGPLLDGMSMGLVTAENITADQIALIQEFMARQPLFDDKGSYTFKFVGWTYPKEGIDWAMGTDKNGGYFGTYWFEGMIPQQLDTIRFHMWVSGVRHDFDNFEELQKAAREREMVNA